ncbi:MAG: exodeoxyribonuclease VII small subunit [Clostridiales bacterium]|nr:exodeoxyribonuclease VII small subunit [Clostridiales bacterium]
MSEERNNMPEEKEASLEDMFGELDEILAAMDEREISLENAFSLYEKGMKKIRLCTEKLDLVEKKMLVISRTGEEEPFEN